MATTRLTQHLAAPRRRVYEALVDPSQVVLWRFPSEMTCEVHEFEPREGGRVRVSLTYNGTDGVGKTSGRTDTYRGRLVRLVPDELVVEVDEFVTDDPALRGEMTMTIALSDDPAGGTLLTATHDGLPAGLRPEDNEAGWREALQRLAELVRGE